MPKLCLSCSKIVLKTCLNCAQVVPKVVRKVFRPGLNCAKSCIVLVAKLHVKELLKYSLN